MKKRLAIISTHPVQYNAPLFELLAYRNIIDIKVFYTWGETVLQKKYDPGFERTIEWDIPLLKGYEFEFLENTAKDKGSHHFYGIINPGIIQSIKNYKPDAVLVYGWAFRSHLKVLLRFKNKIPVFFRGDSTLLDDKGFLSSLKRKLLLGWIYRHVDIALYVGKNNFNYFRKYGLNKTQLIAAPHAIDNTRFECRSKSCKNQAKAFREKLNIPNQDFVFLFAGKLELKKDPDILLKAFANCNFGDDVHLVIVGNGELEKELKNEYRDYQNIHFLDFQNQLQMPAIYEMADIFVLPSKGPGETWGLSVNEAMANGKVVIVSNKCGCAVDIVEDCINGYIFQANTLVDLEQKLKLSYAKKDALHEMQLRSRGKIKMYSLSVLADVIEKTLMNISAKI